jgi:putative membrane protein
MGTRLTDEEPATRQTGEEPDPRFSLANERTFLAWIRTSIALIAGGLATSQLLQDLPGAGWLLAFPLAGLGLAMAAASHGHYREIQRAMRHGEPLPRSPLPVILAIGVTAIGVCALVLILVDEL